MKFYEFIEKLQEINKDKIVLIKSGVFFNSCGRDAIILGKIFNLKRTCCAKRICKVGMPVTYVRENINKIAEKLKEKDLGIIIYDEIENGNFKFNDKSYGILFQMEGKNIEETRKNTNCLECKNNINLNRINNKEYTLKKEDYIEIVKILEILLGKFKEKIESKKQENKKED